MDSTVDSVLESVKNGRDYTDVIDDKGVVIGKMEISPDLIKVCRKYLDGIEKSKEVVKTRESAVEEEIREVGDEVLPVAKLVAIQGGLLGRVVEVSYGYKERPYYKVYLQNADGAYGDPEDENNYGYFYARNLRNYGREL